MATFYVQQLRQIRKKEIEKQGKVTSLGDLDNRIREVARSTNTAIFAVDSAKADLFVRWCEEGGLGVIRDSDHEGSTSLTLCW